MGRHFVFAHVVSQRNDEVLCALMDLSTAERAAVEQSNYCAVKEVRVPKYNRTWSILQGQCGVPSSAVTLVLNQSWVKYYCGGVDFAIIVIYERWFKDYLNVTEELHFSLCLSVFCLFYKTQHSDV